MSRLSARSLLVASGADGAGCLRQAARDANAAAVAATASTAARSGTLRCECGGHDCRRKLALSDEEYRLARRRASAFVMVAEHVDLKHERKVLALGDAWLVVERSVEPVKPVRRRRS